MYSFTLTVLCPVQGSLDSPSANCWRFHSVQPVYCRQSCRDFSSSKYPYAQASQALLYFLLGIFFLYSCDLNMYFEVP